MNKRFLSVVMASGLLAPALIFSSPIAAIHFEGLKRTKDFVLQRDVKKFIGREADEKTLHEIETVLQKEGFLSEIHLEVQDTEGAAEITATVKEKITFIPLPMFSVSGGKAMGGAFILDSNAFGLKHTLAVGGFFSASEYRGIFMYGKPPLDHVPGITLFGSAGKKKQEFVDMDDVTCINYNMISANVGIAVKEKFSGWFSGALSANFGFKDFDKSSRDTIRSNRYVDLKPSFSIDTSDWNGVFMSTKALDYGHEIVIYTDGYIWHVFSPSVLFQQPVFCDDLRFIFVSSGVYCKFVPYSAYVGNSRLGVNILPSKFGTGSGVGASCGLEYAAFKTRFGLFSVYGTYQCVEAEDFDGEYKFNQGAGAGITMYLKQVAIPAMNFGIYYNSTKGEFCSAFSVGISF